MPQRALSGRRLLSNFCLVAALAFAGGAPSSVQAASPLVSVGEVQARGATAELEVVFRLTLIEELARLGTGAGLRRPIVVSATLMKLTSEQAAQTAKAFVAISLALRRADDHVLFAELRGRASAEEARGSVASVRESALRAAVQSAVARLPEVAARAR